MMESTTFRVEDVVAFKLQALRWAAQFPVVCLLDSNSYSDDGYASLEWQLAVDAIREYEGKEEAFEGLKKFWLEAEQPCFGGFSYDLKNQIERLEPNEGKGFGFPLIYFFEPRYLITIEGNEVTVNRNYPETFELRERIQNYKHQNIILPPIELKASTTKAHYLKQVEAIREQIGNGDFYEMNYCCEFTSVGTAIDPVQVFERLNATAAAPFSTFFKWKKKYLLCASPERFLKKTGDMLISQPIKGTIRRAADATENEELMRRLYTSEKERSENVMIVDLVRNDLAVSAIAGTVKVPELFGVYTFNTVNQMISTVTAQLQPVVSGIDAIRRAFPMGSMTGAPKVEVMKNIDRYETQKRGWYSGAVGYMLPDGDFDLNVVIRAIQYDAGQQLISVQAGGAITYDSVPEQEYDELLLKIEAMKKALGAS
ncbi:MAG: anthranilate synthase component I family protein [Chitinophagales bacterium]